MLASPPVLLLDEPTRSLDAAAARRFRDLVRDRAREGVAVLFTTHDLREAADLADRVVVLEDGRVAATLPRGASAEDLEALLTGGAA